VEHDELLIFLRFSLSRFLRFYMFGDTADNPQHYRYVYADTPLQIVVSSYNRIVVSSYYRKNGRLPHMIISLLNQKGGVGKTTLALHIATGLAQKGLKCLVIDADKQNSAIDWGANREEPPLFPILGLPKATLHRELPKLSKDYAHIIIDSPPHANDVARSAIMASDVIVIPVQPSPYDIWASEETVTLIKEAAPLKEKLKSVFVINRKIVNTAIGRDVATTLSSLDFPVLSSQICQRVAFAESAATGMTVLETEPHGLAAQEIEALVTEILTL
jgi:chromosome partitioning protein